MNKQYVKATAIAIAVLVPFVIKSAWQKTGSTTFAAPVAHDQSRPEPASLRLERATDFVAINQDNPIQLVDHQVEAPKSNQSVNRTKSIAEHLKSSDAESKFAREQLHKHLLRLNQQRTKRQRQALNIKELLKRESNGESQSDILAELPAVCLSDRTGWPEPHLADKAGFHSTDSEKVVDLPAIPLQTGSTNKKYSMPRHAPQLDKQSISKYNPHVKASAASAILKPGIDPAQFAGKDPHAAVYANNPFPSAVECKACHEQIYDEWSVSGHAYAAISPMFQKFEQKITDVTQGTIGYFCMRCHAPVATTMKHPRSEPIWKGPRVYREGVTCVACHRVKEQHGKVNGERRMEPGDITSPVYGTSDGTGLADVLNNRNKFKIKTDPSDKGLGQLIHKRVIQFEQLSESTFCMSCHQVAVDPGIKLEVVWDQYRASPAYRDGTTCQDCHMGRVPGMDKGYSVGPAALINGLPSNTKRLHSNHQFYGPGYSIAHPGIFPQNPDADRWSINQWLLFDWRAGWGTDEFEELLAEGKLTSEFPQEWSNVDDRYDARDIINDNFKKLNYKRDLRRQVMENGSHVDGPFFPRTAKVDKPLRFFYRVCNISRGHNLPSGSLGAQPQLWLNVVLIGPNGQRIWESGHLDSFGDLADIHSQDVLDRKIPLDRQLFNLQTKFLMTNTKGTDRETLLPVNWAIDQLPFIRPGVQPITNINHPPFIRMENHSIPATGSRDAYYIVPAELIKQPGTYRLSVRMRSRAEPIYFMRFVEATSEMKRAMNEGILDTHTYTVAFEVQDN